MPSTTDEAPYFPALQERSRRTLERILAATEKLLEKRAFDEIAVAEIVRIARTSIGSFYARFPDKDGLLPLLYERYDAALEESLERAERSARLPGRSLEEAAEAVARHAVAFHAGRLELLRALALFVRRHPGRIGPKARARRARQHAFLLRGLLAHRKSIRHRRPDRAAALGVYFVFCAARDSVLFPRATHAAAAALEGDELVRELSRLLLAYLAFPAVRRKKGSVP